MCKQAASPEQRERLRSLLQDDQAPAVAPQPKARVGPKTPRTPLSYGSKDYLIESTGMVVDSRRDESAMVTELASNGKDNGVLGSANGMNTPASRPQSSLDRRERVPTPVYQSPSVPVVGARPTFSSRSFTNSFTSVSPVMLSATI